MAGTYQVQSNGSAPKGLKAGDKVVTAGGTYTIKSVNADGSYNSSKTSDVSTKTYTGTYSTTGSSSSKTTASQAAVNAASQAAQAKKSSSSKTSNRSVTTVSSNPNSTGYSASQAAVNAANTAAKAKGATTSTSTPAMNWTVNSKPATTQATQVQTPSTGYVAKGTYEDADLRASGEAAYIDEQKKIYEDNQKLYYEAVRNGDTKGAERYYSNMQQAHANAELWRAKHGYSGGEDGSERIATPQGTPQDVWDVGFEKPQTDPNIIDGVYVHPMDQKTLKANDLQAIIAIKQAWPNASPEERVNLNKQAEAIRAGYGYSLGADGETFRKLELEQDMMPQVGLPSYEAQPELVNNVYDKLNESTLQQLLAAYNNSRAQSEYDMSKIPAMYQQQKNLVSADNEREKMAFREQAAASGMNAGNRSQAALAYSNQLQNNLGSLNTAEANALSDAQFALTQLYNSYQQQIASAVAQNNYQRAAALLQEYMTAKQSAVETALNQANLDVQIADFNRQTRLNTLQQQNLMRQLELDQRNADRNYSLDLANSAANNIGAYGPLANLSGLSPADAQKLRQMYSVEKLSTDYPLVRGWLV